ncbi:MAG: hypothetical protein L0H53_13040 [Candidatus Nitrosocosmicus sp.]|nr:hypothetical protein [Candidatus Nitrosocosmicus sp.]MDN5868010.1 hypothetical protein [Candidatus Nitrosocosmicus sp.]
MSHNKINKSNDTENNSEFVSNTNELKAASRRDNLIRLLRKSGCEGMTVLQLKNKLEYKDRKSIPRVINEINKIKKKNQEYERIIKLKKNGNYVLASELAKREIATQYMVFGQDAIRELLGGISNGLNSFIINDSDSNQIYDLMQNEKSFFSEFYEKKKLSEESEILLDFTFKMGSLISFIMLKAIEPSCDDLKEKDGKTKEFESAALVNQAINPSQILFHFMQQDIVKKGKLEKESKVRNLLRNKNGDIKNSPRAKILLENSISDDLYSCYEVNNLTSQKLKNSYEEIWPGTFRLLTKLFEEKRLQKITTRGISEAIELKKNIEDASKSQRRTG